MNRKKKLLLNTGTSLLFQVTAFVCGFILPRLILTYYGSNVNGLVSSITNFLGFITLAECGVGAVVQSAFYKPLAENSAVDISKVFKSSEHFFRIVAFILLAYTVTLFFGYSYQVKDFSFMYTALLIAIMSISFFAQYFFGMTYKLLLNADQLGFIQYGVSIMTLIINTIISVILIISGFSIHAVKLAASLILLLQPLAFYLYVRKHYSIDKKIVLEEEPIKQKWNGLAQHIAFVVLSNADMAVLALFSTLKNVSIYSVYYMIVNGIRQCVVSLTNGITALFGNMIAKNEQDTLLRTFAVVEWIGHTGTVLLFTVCGVLIVPFINIYTFGVNDANYNVPVFAMLLTLGQSIRCIQLPYNIVVHAAGHFKQTQWSSILEASLNVFISVILVIKLGLIGVAIGTIIAVFYRACYLSWYISKNIIYRKLKHYYIHLIVDTINTLAIIASTQFLDYNVHNYYNWALLAVQVMAIASLVTFVINVIAYRKEMVNAIQMMTRRKKVFAK